MSGLRGLHSAVFLFGPTHEACHSFGNGPFRYIAGAFIVLLGQLVDLLQLLHL